MKELLKQFLGRFHTLSIFKKMICYIVFIIVIPLSISFYYSEKNSSEIIIEQVCKDTINSIELVSNSISSLQKRMLTTALFINRDENIAGLLSKNTGKSILNNGGDYLDRLNEYEQYTKIQKLIDNLAYNSVASKSYISMIDSTGKLFSNWQSEGEQPSTFLDSYSKIIGNNLGDFIVEVGMEENYILNQKERYPYVFTIISNIAGNSKNIFIISVPEEEFISLISNGGQEQTRFIIDKSGKIISSLNKSYIGKNFEDIFGIEVSNNKKGYTIIESNNQKKILTFFMMDNGNWRVVDLKSYDDVIKKQKQNRDRLLVMTLICISISLIIALAFTRSITLPLKHLTKDMADIDFIFNSSDTEPLRKDEIGILQQSIETMKVNIAKLIQENKAKEKKKRDAELKAMQAQISPHFLFNTLNAIRWAALNKNNKKAADMVLALSNLLHMTIVKGDELITLSQEMANLENYVDILKMRHGRTFVLDFEVCNEIKNYKIPKLLLQPIAENSIIHGFEGREADGVIKVIGEVKDDNIVITISDNGNGMDLGALNETQRIKEMKFSGIGVMNVDERIKLYYGDQYGLKISSVLKKGTSVSIILPLCKEEEPT